MKRILSAVLATVLCLVLAGCNSTPAEDTLYKTKSTVRNNNHNMLIAEDEDFIYFADSDIIKKMSKEDNSVTAIYDSDRDLGFYHVEYADGRVYALGFEPLKNYKFKDIIISMDTNGENLIKKDFIVPDDRYDDSRTIPNGYIHNNRLYYPFNGNMYKVNPDTLDLEIATEEIKGTYTTADGTVFISKTEDSKRRLYTVDENGRLKLFSDTERSIWDNINITDYYVFYADVDLNNFTQYNLYRTDITGENKTLIKEVPFSEATRSIKYDDKYIYLIVSNTELLKIDKETLQATDISSMIEQFKSCFDVSDEKFFNTINVGAKCYDTVTGEEIVISDYTAKWQ